MKPLRDFAEASFFSLLPRELHQGYRPKSTVGFLRAASFSALLEVSFCYFLVRNFLYFLAFRGDQLNSLSHGALRSANEGTQLYFQFIVSVEYFIHPLSLLLLYLTLEGIVRLLSIFISHENVPSLSIFIALKLKRALTTQTATQIPDEIHFDQGSDHVLKVYSCYPKVDWRRAMTLEYKGELFELAEISDRPNAQGLFGHFFTRKNPATVIRQFVRLEIPNSATEDSRR